MTGVKVDWNSEEKKDLLMVEGGDEVTDLFKYVGKMLQEDTYQLGRGQGQERPQEER